MTMGPVSPLTPLPYLPGLLFHHAAVDFVAHGCGTDLLFFKGPVASARIPGRPLLGSDVDCFVDPRGHDRLVAALLREGWTPYETLDDDVAHYSTVLRHAYWGSTVDLHRRYLGIGIGDQQLFERLWLDRETLVLAGRALPVVSRTAECLVLLLHHAKSPAGLARPGDPSIVDRFLGPTGRDEVLALARDLDALDSVALAAPGWGIRTSSPLGARLWKARQEHVGGGLVHWTAMLRGQQSWGDRWRVLRTALFLHSHQTPLTGQQRLVRWGRALRQVPALLRVLSGGRR